jgi:hypothetical protein
LPQSYCIGKDATVDHDQSRHLESFPNSELVKLDFSRNPSRRVRACSLSPFLCLWLGSLGQLTSSYVRVYQKGTPKVSCDPPDHRSSSVPSRTSLPEIPRLPLLFDLDRQRLRTTSIDTWTSTRSELRPWIRSTSGLIKAETTPFARQPELDDFSRSVPSQPHLR